jgi:predicted dehydrogenase
MEAIEMVEQSKTSNVTISVNNTRRLFPSYGKINELIQSGSIGSLKSIEYINGFYFQWPTASGFYFNHKDRPPRGVLLDQGAHVLDLICWWMGNKPDVIFSQNDSFGGCEGMAIIALKKGGCSIEVKLSWLSQMQNSFKIIGEEGTIEGGIEDWDKFEHKLISGKSKKIIIKCKEKNYCDFADKLVTNFIDVVSKKAIPLIPGIEIIPSIKLIEECYEVTTKLSTPWYDDLEATIGK